MLIPILLLSGAGEYMEESTILEWRYSIGAKVVKGDIVAVVETAKATMDVEAPATGILRSIDAPVGVDVKVGAQLGSIDEIV